MDRVYLILWAVDTWVDIYEERHKTRMGECLYKLIDKQKRLTELPERLTDRQKGLHKCSTD